MRSVLSMTELIPPVNWRMCHPIPHRNTLSYQMCYIPCLYTCCYHASAIPPLTHSRQWKIIVGTNQRPVPEPGHLRRAGLSQSHPEQVPPKYLRESSPAQLPRHNAALGRPMLKLWVTRTCSADRYHDSHDPEFPLVPTRS